jgi:hypothetical protein
LFVCLADNNLKIKTAFVFLEEIRKKFKEKYPVEEIASAFAFGMNSSFSEIYKQQFVELLLFRLITIVTKIQIKRKHSTKN